MSDLLSRDLQIIKDEGLVLFLKKVFWRTPKNIFFLVHSLIHPLLISYATNKLRSEVKEMNEPENLINYSFNFDVVGLRIAPIQIREEILELLKILKSRKIKTVLEIGTASGGTLFLFSQIAHSNATIISIDLPKGIFVGEGYPKWKIPFYKSFAKGSQKIYLIRADSHDNKTLEKVKKILKGRKIDFLFIDGDHTYEGVKKDFEMYGKLVGRGKVIALHDIHDIVRHPKKQVDKFWKEIKNTPVFKTKKIISSPNQIEAGIGLIFT